MKLVIQEAVNNLVEIEKLETIIRIADFDVGLRQMLEAEQSRTFVAIEDITLTDDDVVIQFIDPGGADRDVFLPAVSINNHGYIILNIADNEEFLYIYSGATKLGEIEPYSGIGWFVSNGIEWVYAGGGSESGGGGDTYQMLTNRSGDAVVAGDVLIIDADNNKSVKTTNIAADLRVLGVAHAPINAATEGRVDTVSGMVVDVNCTSGAVNCGEYLTTSATAGKAQAAGYFRTPASFAVALTGKAAGSAGQVEAMLIQDIKQTVGGFFGWALGGGGAASTTNSQRLAIPSATWTTVASAALLTNLWRNCGIGEKDVSAYSIAGTPTTGGSSVATAYKLPYSTDTLAAQASANASAVRQFNSQLCNGIYKGYMCGGQTSAGADVNIVNNLTFSTSTMVNGGTLSTARASQRGVSNGSFIYVAGATCDRINASTDAVAAHADGNLPGEPGGGSSALSYPGTAGYFSTTSWVYKLAFSTGQSVLISGTLPQLHGLGFSISDGLTCGFTSGNTDSPYTQSSAFSLATETHSISAQSVLNPGKSIGASAPGGTY